MIDLSKKVHTTLSMDDTHEGQHEKKRFECEQRKLLKKQDSRRLNLMELVAPDLLFI